MTAHFVDGSYLRSDRAAMVLFATALMASGAAATINQVIWQRALARHLGGVESHSAMLVVLVFMFGMGVGSLLTATLSRRTAHPLRWLVILEFLLVGFGLVVRWLAGADVTGTIADLQVTIAASGFPYRLIYALSAVIVFLPSCLLMGATLPFAAEAAERSFAIRSPYAVPALFGLNTLGATGGALIAGFMAMPFLGYQAGMAIAAILNGAAALLFLAGTSPGTPAYENRILQRESAAHAERMLPLLSAILGFLAMGYEMLLLRSTALLAEPRPHIFALVLALFLLAWGAGCLIAALNHRLRVDRLLISLALCLLAVVVSAAQPLLTIGLLLLFGLELINAFGGRLTARWRGVTLLVIAAVTIVALGLGDVIDEPHVIRLLRVWVLSFVPCLLFGCLFGVLSRPEHTNWGTHAGRLAGANTLGSCLGVLVITLVFFNGCSTFASVAVLTAIAVTIALFTARGLRLRTRWTLVATLALTMMATLPYIRNWEAFIPTAVRSWSSSNGVIAIDQQRNLLWNGLWHSSLSTQRNHIGSNNWLAAVFPAVLCPAPPRRCAVIGLGTGITAATLALVDGVELVDCLELNRQLEELHHAYPEGTLNALTNQKIRMYWDDARMVLATSNDRYDLITSQPLYLKQAGSAYLNSVEFLRLVRARLNPGGIFCLYSNGTPEQALAMRQTALSVFTHLRSCENGYLLLLSDQAITAADDIVELQRRIDALGDLAREMRTLPATADATQFALYLDAPALYADGTDLVNNDDTAHLEYPLALRLRNRLRAPDVVLPTPLQPARREPGK